MNLKQAKSLAQQGVRVKHRYFGDNEWMVMKNNVIIFEDGNTVFFDEWTQDKDYLQDGWEEFMPMVAQSPLAEDTI